MTQPVGSVYLDVRSRGDKLIGDIQSQAKKAADAAEKTLGGRITSALSKAAKTGAKALAIGLGAATIAAAGFAKSTVDIGIQYQSNLNTMSAVTHATAAQMQQAATVARDLGNDLDLPATSAADAAAAMVELGKGGLTADQSMRAAKGTLLLAAAAQVDGATAAEVQANALNAFSLSADKAGHVSDVLANASNAASGEISDFAFGLQASSAVAAQFGLSIDDTVSALGLFANNGIKGSDAGTSLKTALLALANPSDAAAAALRTLGVKAFDADGKFVGLRKISAELADAHGRLSQEAFASATAQAFGADAARAAGILAKEGAQGWDSMSQAISQSGGAAQVAQAQMQGVGGALQGLQSQFETVQIDVFTRTAPDLEAFIRALSDRMPAAADAALSGLDRLIGFTRREIPVVRAQFASIAPVVQEQITSRLEIAARAARDVFLPALRATVTILREAAPAALALGRVVHDALESGMDAAAKVAHQFQGSASGLGQTLSDVAGVVVTAGHAALPVLQVALTAASVAAKVLVTAVAGLHAALGPLAGPVKVAAAAILLGVVAIKALSAAMKRLPDAKTAVVDAFTKVQRVTTTATRTVQANLAAISVAATGSLDKGLTSSSSRAGRAISGVGAAFRAAGAALPVVGLAVAGIGVAMDQSAQKAQQAADHVQGLYQALQQGGQAAQTASQALAFYQRAADAGGVFADKYADALRRGKSAADEYQRSLSTTDLQQQAVSRAQNDLTAAIARYGTGSSQAQLASQAYQTALANQRTTQDQLSQATQTATDKIQAQQQAIRSAASADAGFQQAELGVRQAQLDVATAAKNAADASRTYGRTSGEAQRASLALSQAQSNLRQQIITAAEAARQAAIAHNSTKSAAQQAAAGDAAYRAELGRLASAVAPGSVLRRQLDGLIRDLDNAARTRTSNINIVVHGKDELSFGSGSATIRARASGGPISAQTPYLTGEEGPELIVPRRDGFVIPAGMTQDLLRGVAGIQSTPAAPQYAQLAPTDRALLRAVVDRPVVVRIGQREIARAVRDQTLLDRGR